MDRLDPGNPVYNITRGFRLSGTLDYQALEEAFGAVVARHAPLRTTFELAEENVVARIHEVPPFALERSTLEDIDARSRPDAMERELLRAANHRFDLARDLMIRATLVRLSANDHLLAVVLHHIAVDERSMDILLTDLSQAYRAVMNGGKAERRPPETEFSTYALRERAIAASDGFDAQLEYWQTRLNGAPEAVVLPLDGARPARPRFRGATESATFDAATSADLLGLAPLCGASPFMLMLAAFVLMLHRMGGERDLVVGTPVSARRDGVFDGTIGFFSNAVALRVKLGGDHTFLDIVRLVKSTTLDAFAHSDVPFESVVARVTAERARHAHPIFNVMFAAQSESSANLDFEGVRCAALDVSNSAAKFDLAAIVRPGISEISVGFTYDADLFQRETIAGLLEDYTIVLRAVTASPNVRMSELPQRANRSERAVAWAASTSSGERASGIATAELRAIESDVRPLWEAVLGRTAIPAHEDFFEGGGHSLLAVRLIESIEQKLGVRIPLVAFFETPTLRRLARTIATRALAEQLELQPLKVGSHPVPVVIFHGDMSGGGLYLRSMLGPLGDRTVYALPPHGADGGPIPATIEAMASDRLALLARAGITGNVEFVGYCSGALVALEAATQVARSGRHAPNVIVLEADILSREARRLCDTIRLMGTALRLGSERSERLALGLLRFQKDARELDGRVATLRMLFERGRALLMRTARPTFGAETGSSQRMIAAYQRRLIRYRPQRHDGAVTILFAAGERNSARRMAAWSQVAPLAAMRYVAGDHASCVTSYGAYTADALKGYLVDA